MVRGGARLVLLNWGLTALIVVIAWTRLRRGNKFQRVEQLSFAVICLVFLWCEPWIMPVISPVAKAAADWLQGR